MSPERDPTQRVQVAKNPLMRTLWLLLGVLLVGLGALGILLPGLPTTPFMLLAAACFARSSERFYDWLITNPLFGEKVRRYREGRGLTVRIKILASGLAGLFVGYAALLGIPEEHFTLRLAVLFIGLFGIWFILSRPTDTGAE